MRKLKCFIASAFERADVDEVFRKAIIPTLQQLNIVAMRVDKINHNRNIDEKILELIDDCDFCIADLTFARPSVYYEAGRIHGLDKEVIFIAREDHFTPDKDDVNGNKRIHFDLITKNIIGWKSPDRVFKKRLKQRINLIKKPLERQIAVDAQMRDQELNFASHSLQERQSLIINLSKKFILGNKYKNDPERKGLFQFTGIKGKLGNHKLLSIGVFESITMSTLENIRFRMGFDSSSTPPKEHAIILISLKAVNTSLVHKIFPTFRKEPNIKEFTSTNWKDQKNIRLIIVDNIKSEIDFSNRIEFLSV